ncbi:hypothetical protein [Streptomyces sp. MH60]|uniref:hypothetical protein n=1 Tax=Streptomyces sp. MH60 TaxID=1940758 RepID=UPI000CEE7EF9|nr:hypothetical protein [Streptomyces sp. MH60]PPS72081.1 hypothetical protein BZZ08_07146 [Streptomyces sp. MH60]
MTHQDHRDQRNHPDHPDHRDPYRLGTPQAAPGSVPGGGGPDAVSRGDVLRTLLWAVVVLSAVANMALSFTGAATALHLASGVVTVLAAGALVVRGLRGRR